MHSLGINLKKRINLLQFKTADTWSGPYQWGPYWFSTSRLFCGERLGELSPKEHVIPLPWNLHWRFHSLVTFSSCLLLPCQSHHKPRSLRFAEWYCNGKPELWSWAKICSDIGRTNRYLLDLGRGSSLFSLTLDFPVWKMGMMSESTVSRVGRLEWDSACKSLRCNCSFTGSAHSQAQQAPGWNCTKNS